MHRRSAPRRVDEAHHQGQPRRLHRQGSRARADAAQVPLVGKEAVPSDQLGVGLHRRGDEHLLDGALPAYPNWRNYFDIVIVAGSKPAFFTDKSPFLELDAARQRQGRAQGPFSRDRIYQGGNIHDFENGVGVRGDHVLYVGDHIYGDMLRAKKSSVWRTAMILQELERSSPPSRTTRSGSSASRARAPAGAPRLRDLVSADAAQVAAEAGRERRPTRTTIRWRTRHRRWKRPSTKPSAASTSCAPRSSGRRRSVARTTRVIDRAFNPYWGAIFREGAENSRFGQQVEDYACVYTSRVSNFLAYSPLRYFRSPRDHMPHELV